MRIADGAPLLPSPKKLPLVLLSHGSGGTASKLFWLAEKLVDDGFVVVAVNHPGNRKGDNSAKGLVEVWERAKDLKFALDQVLEKSTYKDRVDRLKIGAAGHSAGGTTVLLLAAARFSKERFPNPIPKCATTKDPYYAKFCDEINKIDFHKYAKDIVEADYSDSRIKAVIAFDPGFSRSFDWATLTKMKARPLIFVAGQLREPADEIHSKDFLSYIRHESERFFVRSWRES